MKLSRKESSMLVKNLQSEMPEAVASVTYTLISPEGLSMLLTIRASDEANLFERMEGVESYLRDAGYLPKGANKNLKATEPVARVIPLLKLSNTCPKCGGTLLKFETKTGKLGWNCENREYDFDTKEVTGCDYQTWEVGVANKKTAEPATPAQRKVLVAKGAWEDGLTKTEASEIIGELLKK